MDIARISGQQTFTAVKCNSNLTSKQMAIFKRLESDLNYITDSWGYDLFVERSSKSYVHQKSGRYEHCAQFRVEKDGQNSIINSEVPNTARAWKKAIREILKVEW